jgi:hypothetical protein
MKHDDPLDELLLQWQVQTPAPTEFRREVWGRIAAGAQPAPSWLDRMVGWLSHPAALAACIAAALLAGGLTAWKPHPPSQAENMAREAYLQSIDPFHPSHLMAAK